LAGAATSKKQKSCQGQAERLVHAAAEDLRGNGREQEDDYGHSHWHRAAHTSRKAIAGSGNIEGECAKRRMEIHVRNSSGPDGMRTVEENKQIFDVFAGDRLVGQSEKS
jgi:hypothetical protein